MLPSLNKVATTTTTLVAWSLVTSYKQYYSCSRSKSQFAQHTDDRRGHVLDWIIAPFAPVLIGRVITLVLVLRHSFEKRSKLRAFET